MTNNQSDISDELDQMDVNKLISLLLGRCGDKRSQDVIIGRYGLITGEKQTLEAIGVTYGLTRERIRQLQVKTLRRLRHPSVSAAKPLFKLVEQLIYENGGLLSSEEADIEMPAKLGVVGYDGSSLLDLLCDIQGIQNHRIGDINIYSPQMKGVSLSELSNNIITLIKKNTMGIDLNSMVKKIDLFDKISDNRFNPKEFVLRYCKTDPRVEEIDLTSSQEGIMFRYYWFRSAKVWISEIAWVLEEEQMPLYYTDIADRVNDHVGNSRGPLDARRAHSILIENKLFAHSGIRGTYGLTSWGLRKETTTELVLECLNKAGFPLHWKQIYNYVSKYKDSKPASIVTILSTNKLFKKVANGTYWLNV